MTVLITRGLFRGREARILLDRGSYASLLLPGMIVVLDEGWFVRLK